MSGKSNVMLKVAKNKQYRAKREEVQGMEINTGLKFFKCGDV